MTAFTIILINSNRKIIDLLRVKNLGLSESQADNHNEDSEFHLTVNDLILINKIC